MKINSLVYKTGKHIHTVANQNRSKMKFVCERCARVIRFCVVGCMRCGSRKWKKMTWFRPQKMKHSKLIFEFFLYICVCAFALATLKPIYPQKCRNVHCILFKDNHYCPQYSPIHFNYCTEIICWLNKFTNHLSTFNNNIGIGWTIEINDKMVSTVYISVYLWIYRAFRAHCTHAFENSITIH